MSPPRHQSASAFTLIELIVVVAIIAVMAVVVTPAITSLGRAAGLVTGGNHVTNLVGYARQVAIGKNTMSALVVLTGQGSPDDFRALTVLEYDAQAGWSQITGWHALPTGIVFDPDPKGSTFLENSPDPFPFLATTNQSNPPVSYKSANGQTIEPVTKQGYAARIFLPSGGLQNPEHPAQLRLVEGFMEKGQVVRTRRDGVASSNVYDIAIIGATGLAKVSRTERP